MTKKKLSPGDVSHKFTGNPRTWLGEQARPRGTAVAGMVEKLREEEEAKKRLMRELTGRPEPGSTGAKFLDAVMGVPAHDAVSAVEHSVAVSHPDDQARNEALRKLARKHRKRPRPKWHDELEKILQADSRVTAREAIERLSKLDGYDVDSDYEALLLPGNRGVKLSTIANELARLRKQLRP